jgi:hypothetical protein
MTGRTCHHCNQWIVKGTPHDCWTTTESALIKDLSEDLQEAYERLRDTVVEFGEQRIYASHKSIMFARKTCYCFVRPKRSALEVVFFLGRAVRAPQVRKVVEASRVKRAHIVHVRHRDEVEAPITDWLAEAYEYCMARPAARAAPPAKASKNPSSGPKKQSVPKKGTKR